MSKKTSKHALRKKYKRIKKLNKQKSLENQSKVGWKKASYAHWLSQQGG